ncbi:hypothetical protein SRHO_G00303640 [Serrasalmus rhombeus]
MSLFFNKRSLAGLQLDCIRAVTVRGLGPPLSFTSRSRSMRSEATAISASSYLLPFNLSGARGKRPGL